MRPLTELVGTVLVTEEMNVDSRVKVLHNASKSIPCIPLSLYLFKPTGTLHNTCMLNSLLYIAPITRAEVFDILNVHIELFDRDEVCTRFMETQAQ